MTLSNENARFYSCQIATSNSVKQHKLRKRIAYLSAKEGRGKEFISLYISPALSLERIVANLKKEADSETQKFENAGVRERFQVSLKTLIQHLRQLKAVPENGLAVFAGTPVSEEAIIEEIAPPQPISCYLYTVDAAFNLEPLRAMLRDQKVVGILALDAKQASFGLLKGEQIELIDSISSGVAGKTGKGGQSQRRYERERDMAIASFFHRVAEHATKAFLGNGVNVLIVGGPGQTKNDFLKGDYLHYELSNMVLNTVDTQSASEAALKEILDKSADILQNMCGPEERRVVRRLMAELAKEDGLATYGLDIVLEALRRGEVKVAIVTDTTNVVEAVAVCKKCGQPKTKITNNKTQTIQEMTASPCEKCGSNAYEVAEKDLVDVLEDLASQTDAAVEVISTASPEKDALTGLGGVAALLRYRPK
jgi:peptide chain release factor subunit 1